MWKSVPTIFSGLARFRDSEPGLTNQHCNVRYDILLFYSDLAVLLRGNKRKTSHIELGAHPAILVVSEAAGDAIHI